MEEEYESVLLIIRECFGMDGYYMHYIYRDMFYFLEKKTNMTILFTIVYKIPPRTAARGYR